MSVPVSFKSPVNSFEDTQGNAHPSTLYRWSLASGLQCPYGSGVDLPHCGKVYDLVSTTEKVAVGALGLNEAKKKIAGRAVFCDPERYLLFEGNS